MLNVTGYLYVAPAELERFMTHLKVLAVVTRQRNENISYDAAVDAGQSILSEHWAYQGALTTHLNADETVEFVNQWKGRMRGDIRKHDAFNGRNLIYRVLLMMVLAASGVAGHHQLNSASPTTCLNIRGDTGRLR